MHFVDSELVTRLHRLAAKHGFDGSSTVTVGELLATLAASKPAGSFLELGTGLGLGTASLLSGMTTSARLTTVELDEALSLAARTAISDPRVTWIVADGADWLASQATRSRRFDLVFADTWPGKFTHLELALDLVAEGGLYVVDDLSPQTQWPAEHLVAVEALVEQLVIMPGWQACPLDIASGLMICARSAAP